ncbi:serine/threonine-protein kinase STY13 [Physcomitrium patens]|uniref:non-specific serine/threonine protein kinase n=1 Tax=Physcomitrium patens TaxID=3218 RepID=A0A2K1JYJ1_PHYPA|nr:serine/threonine-protein kinase STY13-like [Physcomitrium patens]PNR46596.1 hypothetical protein PHYPA_013715 [Physcomitrium patens]|eukprot:XP_024387112.1 serine/threonine-protein kinase STY13-like [Physcomitrella patens]
MAAQEFFMFQDAFLDYRRLQEASDMSVSSTGSVPMSMSNGGNSVSMMSQADSSVGSNGGISLHTRLMHRDLHPRPPKGNASVENSVVMPDIVSHTVGEDVLAAALMDPRYQTEGLEGYDDWTIDLRRLQMGPPFAQGAFGRLYKGTYNGEDVAVKILERPENNVEKMMMMESAFAKEVTMLAAVKHQNVVRFIGACRKPMVWCIVTEYARGGSVRSFLSKRQSRAVPLKLAVKQALDVARGMEYLHSLEIIHRDLKSDNLLIATDKSIKIADFGAARIEVQVEGMTPETGTYRWMAPEMIQHKPYNHKVDVYSFGVVLWELVTGLLPFQNMSAVQAAFAVVNRGVRPPIPDTCPPNIAEIMSRCWDANPDVRPSFAQVVKMLEQAQNELLTKVGRARFRCLCLNRPLTSE